MACGYWQKAASPRMVVPRLRVMKGSRAETVFVHSERDGSQVVFFVDIRTETDQPSDRNLDVQKFPDISVYTVLPDGQTISTATVWARPTKINLF